jgi:hypothetical protein
MESRGGGGGGTPRRPRLCIYTASIHTIRLALGLYARRNQMTYVAYDVWCVWAGECVCGCRLGTQRKAAAARARVCVRGGGLVGPC